MIRISLRPVLVDKVTGGDSIPEIAQISVGDRTYLCCDGGGKSPLLG